MSKIKNWFKNNTLEVKGTNYTHLCLDGGKYNIPCSKENEFLKLYAEAIKNEERMYVVEAKTPIVKLFMDLDIEDKGEEWTKEKILEFCKDIDNLITGFFIENSSLYILNTLPKCKSDYIKYGIHLIWNNFFVTLSDAQVIRELIIFKLSNKWKDIDKFIDECVYTSNGFRMVGSDKLNPKTRVPENRVYSLLSIIRKNNLDPVSVYTLVNETSIRSTKRKHTDMIIPSWAQEYLLNNDINVKKVKRKGSVEVLNYSNDEYKIVEKYLNKILPEKFKEGRKICIKKVVKTNKTTYWLTVNSLYCLNVKREHSSSGPYFEITSKGICQRCFCVKEYDDVDILCKNYRSPVWKLNKEVQNLLFPKKLQIRYDVGNSKRKNKVESLNNLLNHLKR